MKPAATDWLYSRRNFLKASGAAAMAVSFGSRARAAGKQINVYNWDTYIGETTLDTFAKKTGVEVKYDLYANLDDMFAKFKTGNPGYDLIFPSDYMIETMIKSGMLLPVDKGRLSNWGNIDENFRNPGFDPDCKHNVPYFWGTVGVGYRTTKVDGLRSWKTLLDDAAHSGRIALMADSRIVMGITLLYMGHPMNSTDPAHIAAARELLIRQKKHIKAFAPDSGQDMLVSGDVDMAMEWNGDILKVMAEDSELSYVLPDEGSLVWIDGVCIPKGAPNLDNAYAFIDHLHDPVVNAEIADTIHYATSNKPARKLIQKADLENPAIYPPDAVVAKCDSLIEIGDAQRLYDDAWTRIQAA